MRYVEVHGNRLSAIGLGTWQFGSNDWGYGSDYADVEAGRILQHALDLGVNVIDTAEVYGRGNSERIVGRALGDRRKDAFVATKVFPIRRSRPTSRAGAAKREAPRHRRDRSLPNSSTEPARSDRAADGRHAPAPTPPGS